MTEWERAIKESKNIEECEETFDLDKTLFSKYTNYLRLGFVETKEVVTKNVLEQLGYNLKEVLETEGRCVEHNIQWFYRDWEVDRVEYLQVDDKIVGEIRLVNDSLSYKWEGRIYGK